MKPDSQHTPLYALGQPLESPTVSAALPTGVMASLAISFDEENRLPPDTQGYVAIIRAIGGDVFLCRYGGNGATVIANARHLIPQDCTLELVFAKGTGTNGPLFYLAGDGSSTAAINWDAIRAPWREAQRGEICD